MPVNRQEVIVAIGLDHRMVEPGLQSVKAKFTEFGGHIKGIFTSVFGQFGAERIVEKVLSGMAEVLNRASQIRSNAFAKGVSTDFIQDIANVGKAAGVSEEKVEKMLDTFVEKLPDGADVEKSFWNMADGLAAIHDPAARAKAAIEEFGKSGIDMVKIIGNGAQATQVLAAQFDKFTEAELETMEQAKRYKERGEAWLTVKYGQLFQGAAIWGKYLGSGGPLSSLAGRGMSGAITDADLEDAARVDAGKELQNQFRKAERERKLVEHNQQIADARHKLKSIQAELFGNTGDKYLQSLFDERDIQEKISAAKGDDLKKTELQIQLLQQQATTEKLLNDMATESAKKREAAAKVLTDNEKEQNRLIEERYNLIKKYEPSLDELSHGGAFARDARQIKMLDRQIKRDFTTGNIMQADRDIATREKLFAQLQDALSGRKPLRVKPTLTK